MIPFQLEKPLGFSLAAASQYFAGFIPGSGMSAVDLDTLTLAFRVDRTFDPVAVSLREEGDLLLAEAAGQRIPDVEALRKQLSRMLGLEGDGDAWLKLGARDPLVGKLQREFPGFFTAAKPSPYDAAVWAVLAPRMPMKHAANLKMAIARTHGAEVKLAGRSHFVFPAPRTLIGLDEFPGLPEEKLVRLRGVAEAAMEGKLDADRLRALGEAEALRDLQELRGVGPWAASHIYYRGTAPIDALPTAEPRVLHGLAHALGCAVPSIAQFRELSNQWRPFRTWVSVLLSRHLAASGDWSAAGLEEARTAAGRDLRRRLSA